MGVRCIYYLEFDLENGIFFYDDKEGSIFVSGVIMFVNSDGPLFL